VPQSEDASGGNQLRRPANTQLHLLTRSAHTHIHACCTHGMPTDATV